MIDASRALAGKHVLMVFAHCDDELICGWPILQNPEISKSLIIASSDRHNRERRWCSHRRFATIDLCRKLNVNVEILDHPSDFYQADYRAGKLAKFENHVVSEIARQQFDVLFTHNPHGEYGHMDHRFLFSLMLRSARTPLLISDIHYRVPEWTNVDPNSHAYRSAYFRDPLASANLNSSFYRRARRHYEARGVWTWSQEPMPAATLFTL